MDTAAPRTRTPRGADVGIPPRQLDFQHAPDLPRRLVDDNITATTFLVVLSGAFPPGEDFFVRSVRHFARRVTDPVLRARVAGFTGQEVIHSREHDRLNDVFRERGIDVDLPVRATAAALSVLELLPARQRMVCTAFMEHFTAVLAEELLREDRDFAGRIHPDLRELWLWHALEELEHKSVTYDVYEVIGNRRRERLLAQPLVAGVVLPALLASWAWLAVDEQAWRRPGDVADGLRLLLGPGGFVRNVMGRLPPFGRRDFHPDRHDTTALEARWRERLFGDGGTLRTQLRRPAS